MIVPRTAMPSAVALSPRRESAAAAARVASVPAAMMSMRTVDP